MPEAVHVGSGKVRELYALDDERLLLVASDRISVFDVVLPTEIPDKGRVLTGLSGFWFTRTLATIVPNHLLAHPRRRTLDGVPAARDAADRVRRPRLPRRARAGRTTARRARSAATALPEGLRESDKLPEPIFTPATKAQTGPRREHHARAGGRARRRTTGSTSVERISLELYAIAAELRRRRAGSSSPTRSSSSASTRTGSSSSATRPSRPTPRASGRPTSTSRAGPQPSFDKQFVRDYAESLGWDKTAPGPELPDDVVAGTRARYVEAFEQITGIPFDDYAADPRHGAAMKATVLVRPKPGILDPEGKAVETSLRHLGFTVEGTRIGRLVDLEVEASDPEEARAEVERMCAELLANPLIESYEIELSEGS